MSRRRPRSSGVLLVKLDSNENPYGPSPLAVKAMQAALAWSNWYPDNGADVLRTRLAQVHGVGTSQIIVAGGLTDLLGVLARARLGPGLDAVTSERSFIVYRIAVEAAGGQLIEVPMQQDTFDLPALAAAVNEQTRIVFVANPNNPTGTIVPHDEMEKFLAKLPEHVVVVLDEAYYAYALYFAALRGMSYSRSLDYVRKGRQVMVLRTFSKAHGLAGVRVGYGIGPAELVASINRQRTIYCVSAVAQAAALAALDDNAHIRRSVENNAREAKRLAEAISGLGFSAPITWTNFLYCEVGKDAREVATRLELEGVAVRPLEDYGAPAAIRITIGTAEQNKVFLDAFRRVMKCSLKTR